LNFNINKLKKVMQELINKLMGEVGLTPEQAQKTVSSVLEFVKSKVPPALSGNIEAMFSGMGGEAKVESYKDKATDFAEATKDKLEDIADEAKDKMEDLAEEAKEKLSVAADKAEEMAKDALGKLKGMFGGDK
jgi:hypothetical protein